MNQAVIGVLALAAAAATDDVVVPLKGDRFVSGELLATDGTGLTVRLWGGNATIRIPWELIPERFRSRFRAPDVGAEKPRTIKGVRLITDFRVVEGLLIEKDLKERVYVLKTKDSRNPKKIPIRAVLAVEEIELRPEDVYTPEELLEAAKKDLDMENPAALEAAAQEAVRLGFPSDALELYRQARAIFEKRMADLQASGRTEEEIAPEKEKIQAELDRIDRLIRNMEAEAILKGILDLADAGKYDEAIEQARNWLSNPEYEGTEARRKNADLVERLTAEKEQYLANRNEVLSRKMVKLLPQMVRKKLRIASRSASVAEALKVADGLDGVLQSDLAQTLKITPEEVRQIWDSALPLREKNKHRASMGSGTWITRGGQDGGPDARGVQQPRGQAPGGDERKPQSGGVPPGGQFPGGQLPGGRLPGGQFPGGQFPGMGSQPGGRGRQPQNPGMGSYKPRQLQTKDQWWGDQSPAVREGFLEAYWAEKSGLVQKDPPKEKNCPRCAGAGSLKTLSGSSFIDVICPRCHGARIEVEITWW